MNVSDLRLLEIIVRWTCISLCLLLLWHWLAWGNIFEAPFLVGYLAVSIIDLVWNPHAILSAMLIVPWQLALLFCSLLESVRICFPPSRVRARRLLLLFMLCFGTVGMSLLGAQQYLFTAMFYRGLRQYTHVGLASTALFGIIFVVINGSYPPAWPMRHYLILTAHLFVLAGLGFLPHPQTLEIFLQIRICYLASVCLCAYLWLLLGSLPRFQSFQAFY